MATQKGKRKLAAILSADVKGYSRLMGEDEVGTLLILNAYKKAKEVRRIRWFHYEIGHEPWGGENEMPEVPS